jgi:multiple sugar transport system permease protein/putative aldouronate transport system permease protein
MAKFQTRFRQNQTAKKITSNKIRQFSGFGDRAFITFVFIFLISFVIICILPLWMVISASLTPELELRQFGFQLFPKEFTTFAYNFVFSGKQIVRSYVITLTVTGLGTLLAMAISTPLAYLMASKKARYSPAISFFVYFTMILGGSLVGFYILMARWLDLRNTIWAMILPYLINPFFAFILVAYFRTIPQEIIEAAIIDGANDLTIFWKVAVPLAKPALASVSLFYALRYWNDWWLSLLFIDDPKLYTLQVMIRQLQSQVNSALYMQGSNINAGPIPTLGVIMATVVLTIGPIVLLYPIVQRYFVKGMLIGAVKG